MEAKSFDTLVIGSGPAGLLSSIGHSHNSHVTLLEKPEKNNTLGKRILLSGNGRCNFFNEAFFKPEFYQQYPELTPLFEKNIPEKFFTFLEKNGFPIRKEGDLYYPYFNRSESMHSFLLDLLKKSEVETIFGTLLSVDPLQKQVHILLQGQKVTCSYNRLVLALGGMSYDRKENPLSTIHSLSLKTVPFTPGLCPIKVKEKIPSYLEKNRLKGTLHVFSNQNEIYQETGEILFKHDGLSGICIFNSTLYITKELKKKSSKITLSFSYLPKGVHVSDSSLPHFLFRYLKEYPQQEENSLSFTFESLYPFSESQVSFGGINPSEIDFSNMCLIRYPDIQVLGEMIDLSFPCGGYHIGSAFLEGYLSGGIYD